MEKEYTFKDYIRDIQAVNASFADKRAIKFFGKPYAELSRDEQLDIDDMIREDNE